MIENKCHLLFPKEMSFNLAYWAIYILLNLFVSYMHRLGRVTLLIQPMHITIKTIDLNSLNYCAGKLLWGKKFTKLN